VTYGGDYPGTQFDFGGAQGTEFATTPLCGGPFGADSTISSGDALMGREGDNHRRREWRE
jgi:hypothetical protein